MALIGTYGKGIDVDKVYWISPESIVYCSLKAFNIYEFKGQVIGGDWDRLEEKFEDLDVYVALKQVCIEGKDWTETVFYQRVVDLLNSGHIRWGCKNKSEFDQRCRDLELLFHRIKSGGYKSQREILSSQKSPDRLRAEDEVTVSIGRNGDLLFGDGAHRLSIAKHLGIQRIPVKVAVRHPEWMSLRRELLLYAKERGGKIHHLIAHPDLNDVSAFGDCEG